MKKFKLQDYISAIQAYAESKGKSPADAVHDFIVNLATMRPHNEGFGTELNFHQLGQQWNDLKYVERSAQQDETIRLVQQGRRRTPGGKE